MVRQYGIYHRIAWKTHKCKYEMGAQSSRTWAYWHFSCNIYCIFAKPHRVLELSSRVSVIAMLVVMVLSKCERSNKRTFVMKDATNSLAIRLFSFRRSADEEGNVIGS